MFAAGQSNEVGQDDVMPIGFVQDPRVTYIDYVDGLTPITFLGNRLPRPPYDGLHGCEVTLANGLATTLDRAVSYRKLAIDGIAITAYTAQPLGGGWLIKLNLAAADANAGKLYFLWWQGESEASGGQTQAYYLNQLQLLAALTRASVAQVSNSIHVRFGIVRLNAVWLATGGLFNGAAPNFYTGGPAIAAAEDQFAAIDEDAEIISLDSMDPLFGLHYGNGQQITAGTLALPQIAAYWQ